MIPQNELRIGSAIKDPSTNSYLVLENIRYEGRELFIHDKATTCEDLQGIPLTEEILEKCGFELSYGLSDPNYDLYKKGDIALNREYRLAFKCSDQTCTIGEPLQYLHQLQNLYFDLCREELRVNL